MKHQAVLLPRLTQEQEAEALRCAVEMNAADKRIGLTHQHYPGHNLDGHVLNVRAQIAACQHFGQPFHFVLNSFNEEKVDGLRIRATKYYTGHVLIHPDDPDEDVFALITSKGPGEPLYYHGSIKARDAKRPEWWNPDAPNGACYYVPQEALTPCGAVAANTPPPNKKEQS
jgi:hypothetical protein